MQKERWTHVHSRGWNNFNGATRLQDCVEACKIILQDKFHLIAYSFYLVAVQ